MTRQILRSLGKPESLIRRAPDRKGHDFRYALDWEKIRDLGWQPQMLFEDGLRRTVDWYLSHGEWWRKLIEKATFKAICVKTMNRIPADRLFWIFGFAPVETAAARGPE